GPLQMGMAVCGNNPSSKAGEYFEAAILQWLPLVEVSQHFAPKVCAACKDWDSNDGDGLDADGARRLAVALEQALVAGKSTRTLLRATRSLRRSRTRSASCAAELV